MIFLKKLNRRGFSLIELLGAIVILGVLSSIGVISVSSILAKAKTNFYTNQHKSLVLAAQSYAQSNRNSLPKIIGQSTNITLAMLKNSKYIEDILDYGKQSCDEEASYVKVFKYSNNNYSYKAYLSCPNYPLSNDLNINNPISVDFDFNTKYKDASVTFSIDSNDGEEAVKLYSYSYIIYRNGIEVKNSGNINANLVEKVEKTEDLTSYLPGIIKVEVTATNIYENTSTIRSEDIRIEDKKPPTCGTVTGAATSWTKEDRTITVQCIDNESGCKREYYTKTFTEETNQGTIIIQDNQGNMGRCKVSVKIDRNPPSCPNTTVTVNNSNISINTPTKGPIRFDFDFVGDAKTYDWYTTDSDGNFQFQSSNNVSTTSKTISVQGNRYVKLVVYDEAQNSVECSYGPYIINREAPSCPNVTATSGNSQVLPNKWAKGNKINFTIDLTGIAKYDWYVASNGGEYALVGSDLTTTSRSIDGKGSHNVKIRLYDSAGNSRECTYGSYLLDNTKPAKPTIVNPYSGQWYNEQDYDHNADSYVLTCNTTENGSGISYWQYKYDNTDWTTYENSDATSFVTTPFTKDRNEYVYIRACDKAGNCSDSTSSLIRIDKIAPDTPQIYNPFEGMWFNIEEAQKDANAYKLECRTQDGGGSGISDWQYKYDNTNWISYDNSSALSFVTTPFKINRNENVYIRVCDNAGNCSNSVASKIQIDKVAPETPTIDNPFADKWYNEEDSIREVYSLTYTTAESVSGINYWQYKYNNTDWSNYASSINKTELTTTVYSQDRNENIYVRACDKAGNCSSSSSTTIKIDTKPPTQPSITNPFANKWYNSKDKSDYELTCSTTENQNGSGIDYWQYKYANTDWTTYKNSNTTSFVTTPFIAERNEDVYIRTCDKAGNCSKTASTKIQIDKNPPTVQFQMKNNSAVVSESQNGNRNYYVTSSTSGSIPTLNWLAFHPELYFTVTDTTSGVKNSAKFAWNQVESRTLSTNLIGNETLTAKSQSNGTYYFSRPITVDGYRYISMTFCDNAGNCGNQYIYFKADTSKPDIAYVEYDSKQGNLKFSCVDRLSGITNFSSTDSVGGSTNQTPQSVYEEQNFNHWWSTSNTNGTITATCTNALGKVSKVTVTQGGGWSCTYKTVKIDDWCTPAHQGSENSICSSTATVCGGHAKYTDCVYDSCIATYKEWSYSQMTGFTATYE